MKTCLYVGRVSHSRLKPRWHSFRYRLSLLWLNLDELDRSVSRAGRLSVLSRWWQALLPVKAGDHLRQWQSCGSSSVGLAPESRAEQGEGQSLRARLDDLVRARLGIELEGPVFLLTGFGFLWHRFNPVSFYYCFDSADNLQCLVAEVTNTPWKEQHYYALDARSQEGQEYLQFTCAKNFHVSPFMPMDTSYRWRLNVPREHLGLTIDIDRNGEHCFSASINLKHKPLCSRALWSCLWLQPFTSLQVVAAIHWQALRLWLKSTPLFPHPKHSVGEKS